MSYRTPDGCKADPGEANVDDVTDASNAMERVLEKVFPHHVHGEVMADTEGEEFVRFMLPNIEIRESRCLTFPDLSAKWALVALILKLEEAVREIEKSHGGKQ